MNSQKKLPLVTLALFSYNQEKFISEAVHSVLGQTYEKLEIIISDDCSTDNTFSIIKTIVSNYSGIHNIIINQNKVNLGLAKHFNNIIKKARGEIIVVAAGDDISLPTRVTKTVEIFTSDPNAMIVAFTDVIIDTNGKKKTKLVSEGWRKLRKISLENYISGRSLKVSGASRGFRRKIYDMFGDLNKECPTEDTPYIIRGLMMGHAIISSECGILYRKHDNNLSGPTLLHKMNFEEIKKQYLCDCYFAYSVALINEILKVKITDFAERNYMRRKIASDFYGGPQKLRFFYLNVMLSNHFNFIDKVKMLLICFRY